MYQPVPYGFDIMVLDRFGLVCMCAVLVGSLVHVRDFPQA